MNSDTWIKLLGILVSLIQAISWPLIVLSVLLYLRSPLKTFIENLLEVTLKAGPIETTVKRQEAIEAAVSLAAAIRSPGDKPSADVENAHKIARLVDQVITSHASRKLYNTLVLWVDDKPSNNIFERNALEALGIHFTLSTSTNEALKEISLRKYNLIISDMGRPPDSRAGYTLLEEIKKMTLNIPFIIYAVEGDKLTNKAEAIKRGAFESTSRPQDLFEFAISAIEKEISL